MRLDPVNQRAIVKSFATQERSKMIIQFTTTNATYDFNTNCLTTLVERHVEHPLEIPADLLPELAKPHLFNIELDFARGRYLIAATDDAARGLGTVYMSRILAAFVEAFDQAYALVENPLSPQDAFDAPLIFQIEH